MTSRSGAGAGGGSDKLIVRAVSAKSATTITHGIAVQTISIVLFPATWRGIRLAFAPAEAHERINDGSGDDDENDRENDTRLDAKVKDRRGPGVNGDETPPRLRRRISASLHDSWDALSASRS